MVEGDWDDLMERKCKGWSGSAGILSWNAPNSPNLTATDGEGPAIF